MKLQQRQCIAESCAVCWVAEDMNQRKGKGHAGGRRQVSHPCWHVAANHAGLVQSTVEIQMHKFRVSCFFHSSGIYSACKMTSYRGTSRGFGRRGGGGSWRGNDSRSRAENRQPPALTPPRPLGPMIDSINSKTLLIEEDAPTVQDVEYVASYNWLDGRSPIILVPGQYLIFCFIPIDI